MESYLSLFYIHVHVPQSKKTGQKLLLVSCLPIGCSKLSAHFIWRQRLPTGCCFEVIWRYDWPGRLASFELDPARPNYYSAQWSSLKLLSQPSLKFVLVHSIPAPRNQKYMQYSFITIGPMASNSQSYSKNSLMQTLSYNCYVNSKYLKHQWFQFFGLAWYGLARLTIFTISPITITRENSSLGDIGKHGMISFVRSF